MKKLCLLLALLLLLSACGAPAQTPAEPEPEPSAEVTASPGREPAAGPLEPDSAGETVDVRKPVPIPSDMGAPLPEQEFDVDSVWGTPEPDGRVMLLLSAESGGMVSGALYDAGRLEDDLAATLRVEELEEILDGTQARAVKFTVQSGGDGRFYDRANGISLTIDGDTLSFDDGELTANLVRLTREEAPIAWARMPLFEEEVKVSAPLEGRLDDLLKAYGEAITFGEYRSYFELETDEFGMFGPVWEASGGVEMYSVFSYWSYDNGEHRMSVRGIETGDSAAEVAARFPNGGYLPDCDDRGGFGQLYGTSWEYGYFGSIYCTGSGVPEVMVYSFGGRFIKLYFDENGYLSELSWCLERW